jgi:hypothetical protein
LLTLCAQRAVEQNVYLMYIFFFDVDLLFMLVFMLVIYTCVASGVRDCCKLNNFCDPKFPEYAVLQFLP